ncbi:hypothetical protein M2271_006891 [Streptomyces sp. LBL]|uniref:hypothetical protein n=1 Tax=Streptomyces sp. LBL TaxID=2940562 RepID=UPI002475A814|nr:hypothetical protein [Streptomyces sp. LBL]MDH6629056.1 hypothetical protein [Streptomyces sp. LBL]
MNDVLTNLVIPTALSMVIGECTEVSPWLARRVLRLAARLLGNPEATERYEAEWVALLDERPGKLLKLFFAIWIALRGTWTLRSIHRPAVSGPESRSDRAAASDSEEPQQPPARDGQHDRPRSRPRPAVPPSGVVVRGHYRVRRRWPHRTSSQRPPNMIPLGLTVLALWAVHLVTTTDDLAGFAEAAASLSFLAVLTWLYCTTTMKRVRSRLAAASLRKEDWALRITRIPDGTFRRIRKALADGEDVHLVVPGHNGASFVRVIDIPPLSGLAVVARPRRRPQS